MPSNHLQLISWISLPHQSGCRCAGVLGGAKAGRGECIRVSVFIHPRRLKTPIRFPPVCATAQQNTIWTYQSGGPAHVLHFQFSQSELDNQSNLKHNRLCFQERRANLAHELFVILDFLSWWPRKVNPCIAVYPMNTKYGWIKHFHSSHYYLISCLTELSVWSNPWGSPLRGLGS